MLRFWSSLLCRRTRSHGNRCIRFVFARRCCTGLAVPARAQQPQGPEDPEDGDRLVKLRTALKNKVNNLLSARASRQNGSKACESFARSSRRNFKATKRPSAVSSAPGVGGH